MGPERATTPAATAYVIAAVTATTITLARNLTTVPPLATSGTFDVSLASGPLARADLEVVYDPILEVSVVARTDGGSFVDDGFEIGQVVVLRDAGANDNSAGVPYVVVDVSDDLLVLDAQLTDGVFVDATVAGSLPRPALTATGGARYPMNGPMSVDGGAGENVLDITATELGDHLVLGESTVDGAGLGITHRSVGLLVVDALQGNDTVDVLATAPGVITLVVGGLGSDVINVAGDVVGDVLSRDPTGTPTTVNYLLTSADVDYATVVGPGVAAAVARATQGGVVVVDSGGDSHVRGLPNGTPIGTVDSVGVRLAAAPTSDVWVTVSAAASPLVQRPDAGPSADSVYVCTTSAVVCATAAGYFHTVYVDGVPTLGAEPRGGAALHLRELGHHAGRLVRGGQRHPRRPGLRHLDQPVGDQRGQPVHGHGRAATSPWPSRTPSPPISSSSRSGSAAAPTPAPSSSRART